jgi:hypothetical protein
MFKNENNKNDHIYLGAKKRCAQERQTGVREMKEGKNEMPFLLYIEVAKYFWKRGDFFSSCYLTH